MIHKYLSEDAYWCKNIPKEIVEKSINNSCNFGLYQHKEQIGFARVVTDYATFAYLADVFILPEFRGKGLSKWLIKTIIEFPDLQGLRRWILATMDAHKLYEKYAEFTPIANPDRLMERRFPDLYSSKK